MTTEFKVGLVVLLGIVILFYMSFKVGKFGTLTEGHGYIVTAHFRNIAGLDTKSPVEVAGVEVGRISKIALDGTVAKTWLLMKEGVKIPVDSKVAIKSFGILGDKYIEITPGLSTEYVGSGEELKNIVSYADYDEIFQNVSVAAKNMGDTLSQFKGVIDEKDKENFKQSLANIRAASGGFKEMVAENKTSVNRIVANVAQASVKLGPITDKADSMVTQMNTIVQGVGEGKGTLGKLVKDEKLYDDAKDLVANLKSVSSDIEQGKGTLGKLVKDDALYNDARDTMKNVNQFTAGLKEGNLVGEAQVTMKKIQQAAEGVQEQTPITILGTIFGLFF
jgi:phospholipid/cholesterol/gamma-HCH transport system substrate-binding protein